jgi:hypothetical protein
MKQELQWRVARLLPLAVKTFRHCSRIRERPLEVASAGLPPDVGRSEGKLKYVSGNVYETASAADGPRTVQAVAPAHDRGIQQQCPLPFSTFKVIVEVTSSHRFHVNKIEIL